MSRTASGTSDARRKAAVAVVGELARSPRMLAHARALLAAGFEVELIGGEGRPVPSGIAEAPGLTLHMFDTGRSRRSGALHLLHGLLRSARLVLRLTAIFIRAGRTEFLLVQNPPAIPLVPFALLAARLSGARLVIDWHNTTASMLALRQTDRGMVVRLVKRLEWWLGRRADANLAVTPAMAEMLEREGIGRCIVLPDFPSNERASDRDAQARARAAAIAHLRQHGSIFGSLQEAVPLVISPTSWTADEDMNLLFEAAGLLERSSADVSLALLLSGEGPGRAAFEARLRAAPPGKVTFMTGWLPHELYPVALASADLGLSLHRSSSGVDFPMKIVEMLGAGVPVCAFDYGPVLRERVREGKDGFLFRTAAELAAIFERLFVRGSGSIELATVRSGMQRLPTWEEEWTRRAGRLFEIGT